MLFEPFNGVCYCWHNITLLHALPTHSTIGSDPGVQKGDWTALVHGARFSNNGKYICGYVDSSQDLLQVLENYRTITGTGFSNAQSLGVAMKPVDETVLQTRFMSPSSRPRLFWQMNAGEPTIPYDGVPFMSVGQNTDLPCVRFGGRRKKVEQVTLPSGSVVPVDFRMKTGCEAKITVRRILRYPSAEYTDIGTQGIAAVRRMRRHILEELVQKVIAGVAKTCERYYFLLPTPLAHTGHAVPEVDTAPALAQPVADEIINQLSQGVTDIVQIRDHIKNFVDATLGAEAPLHVNDSAYYPTEYDIFRHLYWLYKTGQVIDQETAIKAKLGSLPGIEQDYNPAVSTPSKMPVTSAAETITSVYSIIMDEGGASEGAAALEQLSESQIRTEREVELNSSEEIHKDMDGDGESGQQSTPITIPTLNPTHPLAQLVRRAPLATKQQVYMPPASAPSPEAQTGVS